MPRGIAVRWSWLPQKTAFIRICTAGSSISPFFTEELPAFIKNVFPVSKRREDTFTAGLSMGGYGAWFLALSRPDLYAKAASLSGAVDIAMTYEATIRGIYDGPFPWEEIFKDPKQISGSNADLLTLYDKCRAAGNVPQLYSACGTEDFVYEMNRQMKARLEEKGASIVYEEGEGGYTWDFWDQYIQKALKWMLPL
ncbi:MAG: alpha/beta hydrolase-fold protein [Lacrimispora sp.]